MPPLGQWFTSLGLHPLSATVEILLQLILTPECMLVCFCIYFFSLLLFLHFFIIFLVFLFALLKS